MMAIEDISPTERVRRAKARYCRFVDSKLWDDFAELFVTYPRIRMYDQDQNLLFAFDSRNEFIASTMSFLEGARSSHHIHNDEIDLISESEISAIWAMEDFVVIPEPLSHQPAMLHGFGHYHETWVLTPGGWRIASLDLRRTILNVVEIER